jgi:AcrR family transcriptional regulator
VPKRVDHEERRQQIADALLRAAAARGLHAVGMREVAAEAGVSLRLVQYYFGTKEELLLFAMQRLAVQFAARAMARIKATGETGTPASPRVVIAAILTEGLPADDERRTFSVLNAAYFALSLTDPALAIGSLAENSDAVIGVVAAQLRGGPGGRRHARRGGPGLGRPRPPRLGTGPSGERPWRPDLSRTGPVRHRLPARLALPGLPLAGDDRGELRRADAGRLVVAGCGREQAVAGRRLL